MLDTPSAQPLPPPDEQALETRVESMMGPNPLSRVPPPTPRPAPIAPPAPTPSISPPKEPSLEKAPGKPDISDTLLNQIGAVGVDSSAISDLPPPAPAADDDTITGDAVDDIIDHESEETATDEDEAIGPSDESVIMSEGRGAKFSRLFKHKGLWIFVIIVLIAVFAVPQTRYKALGLVFKKPLTITVIDSRTNTPVSNVTLQLNGATAKTDAAGKAILKVPAGSGTLLVQKQYYKTYSVSHFTSLGSNKPFSVRLVATGRQVPITVLNKITGKPIAGVEISLLKTDAKTNRYGEATIVLPVTTLNDTATVSLSGYNTATAGIVVTSASSNANIVNLTPNGHIYFLSDSNGTVDVLKSNLDGTGRQMVLAGTGKENLNTTSLLATRDWRYLVLKSQRSGAQSALYLIDTSNDKITEFDNSNANFTLIGWYGHDFIYDMTYNAVPDSQNGHEALKSYNADTGQLNLLDQNQAEGTATDFAYQDFQDIYIINGLVVYNTEWNTANVATSTSLNLVGLTDVIHTVQPNGQDKKDLQSVSATATSTIQAVLATPQTIDYAFHNASTNAITYYQFANQTVTPTANLTPDTFNQAYPDYLFAPSGNQTFWDVLLDSKNSLMTGDQNALHPKQIATFSNYSPYGWYSDSYVIVSQNNSLYIMPATGTPPSLQPIKITDYYQELQSYNTAEYSYGGL